MTEKCYDEGTIQAFLDGELAQEISQKVTRHIAACDACAFMLADAEEETAFAFAALEREFDTLVPTNRLWTKINDSIVEEKKQTSVWQRFLSFVSVSLMSPSMAVAAGILIFVGVFAVVLTDNNLPDQSDVAEVEIQTVPKISLPDNFPVSVDAISETASSAAINVTNPVEKQDKKVYQAVKRETSRRADAKTSIVQTNYIDSKRSGSDNVNPPIIEAAYLPGEETYVKTIANLSETVETQKDTILRPSARISFERDLAVVDDAIDKMKREVKKNPKNEAAKQVLYSSYQNKIDLLNSVAEKTELMASLK